MAKISGEQKHTISIFSDKIYQHHNSAIQQRHLYVAQSTADNSRSTSVEQLCPAEQHLSRLDLDV